MNKVLKRKCIFTFYSCIRGHLFILMYIFVFSDKERNTNAIDSFEGFKFYLLLMSVP